MTDTMRAIGIVKFFNEDKGHGFITAADAIDFFAHASQLVGDYFPLKNDRVEFTPDNGKDGRPFARKIVILSK
jgi:cold shock CspA family protein